MKTSLSHHSLAFTLFFITLNLANSQDGQKPDYIGATTNTTVNINNHIGTDLQDIKRATGWFLVLEANGEYKRCSCTLVNNTKQNKTPYILTANSCISHLPEDQNLQTGLFSFDYEMPNSEQGDQNDNARIASYWNTEFFIRYRNEKTNIALLELIAFKDGLLANAYAAGWDNTISEKLSYNISHPKGDHKKVFRNPLFTFVSSQAQLSTTNTDNNQSTKNYGLAHITIDDQWEMETHLQPKLPKDGSVGSGGFSTNKYLLGVLSKSDDLSTFPALTNDWATSSLDRDGLAKYLDPKDWYLSHLPGGYLNDLVDMTSEVFPFDLTVESRKPSEEYQVSANIQASAFFDPPTDVVNINNGESWFKTKGIFTNNTLNQQKGLVLTVWYNDVEPDNNDNITESLLLGLFTNKNTTTHEFNFNGDYWDCNNPPNQWLPNCNRKDGEKRITEQDFSEPRQAVLDLLREKSDKTNAIQSLMENDFPVKIRLENLGDEDITIRAFSFRSYGPQNALQFFKPNDWKHRFNYYKYPPSKGGDGIIYINGIEVKLKRFFKFSGECVSRRTRLYKLTTGPNGGYLNLANDVHKIKDILASNRECPNNKNELTISLRFEHPNQKYYGAWIDYDKEQIEDEYLYDFKTTTPNDNAIPEQITVSNGPSPEIFVTITHKLPFEDQLNFVNFNNEDKFRTRLRVAAASAPEGNNQTLTPNGTYLYGEVEDYLLEIRKWTDDDKSNFNIRTARIRLNPEVQQFRGSTEIRSGEELQNIHALQERLMSQYRNSHNSQNTESLFNLITTYLPNLGTLAGVFSRLVIPSATLLTQNYKELHVIPNPVNSISIIPNDLNPKNFTDPNNPFNPNNKTVNDGNPANINSPLNYDDINLNEPGVDITGENLQLLLKIYANLLRIKNHHFLEIPSDNNEFDLDKIYDQYEEIDQNFWSIYKELKTALDKGLAGFTNTKLLSDIDLNNTNPTIPKFIISRMLYFLNLNPKILETALPDPTIRKKANYLIYNKLIPFFMYFRNLPWFSKYPCAKSTGRFFNASH